MSASNAIRILIVEDDADQRKLVGRILRTAGYETTECETAEAGLAELSNGGHDLLLCDWKLPGMDGMELLRRAQSDHPETALIMATAYGSISHAVQAVRLGADDYLVKPFQRQVLLLAVERAMKSRLLVSENRKLSQRLHDRDRLVELIGTAPAMQQIFRRIEKVAGTDATVLISGESGTGKELAARALHTLSQRSENPFVVVDCTAIPEGLMESELFGAEKGAYTGAEATRVGKFELAHQGTLFLDEIGELSPALQPKLLRFLQEGEFTRVGGAEIKDVDVRIVAATNRNLAAAVEKGSFRKDLFYRLNVVPLTMPPLRDRREDIPVLIEFFLSTFSRRHGFRAPVIPRGVMRRLVDHSWQGNVRELGNVIERLVLLSEDGKASTDDLPEELLERRLSPGDFELPSTGFSWEEHEKEILRQALQAASGNRSKAARLLDLPYKAFLYRLEKYQLVGPEQE